MPFLKFVITYYNYIMTDESKNVNKIYENEILFILKSHILIKTIRKQRK